MTPIHKHDCNKCTFLGTIDGENGITDLYHCMQDSNRPTVISRYGIDGDYGSGLANAKPDGILALYIAKLIAISKGLEV